MQAAANIEARSQHYLREVFGLKPEREVVVLLSGGVDSSVVLAILRRYGCQNISAYYLKIWFQEDAHFLGDCPWEADLHYAAAVCEQFDVPLHVLPMQQEYYQHVVEYTLNELRRGHTPSPDLFCNQFVKFGAFCDFLRQRYQGRPIPLIASGHYALLRPWAESGEVLLQQAPDLVKDQSYFLARLSQQQLQGLLFPLGCLQKFEVRQLAEAWGLATARRKDSQGICFLGKVKFRDFAFHYLGHRAGPILDFDSDNVLGEHQGLWFYTIGQRQGLGLGSGPWFVYSKDMDKDILYVRHADKLSESASQSCEQFHIAEPSWLQSRAAWDLLRRRRPKGRLRLKLRHGPVKIPCELERSGAGWRVRMESGDRGVAPGQFAIFYWDEVCLGSAGITQPELCHE